MGRGKARENLRKHGVDFAIVEGFDWEPSVVFEDVREAYHERRWVAFAPIGDGCLRWCSRCEATSPA